MKHMAFPAGVAKTAAGRKRFNEITLDNTQS